MLLFKRYGPRFWIGLAVMLAAVPLYTAFARENYSVTVNGVPLVWEEAAPAMAQGRLTVPLNSFCAALGAEVEWNANKQEVFVFWQGRYAWMQIDNPTLYYGPYIQGHGNQLTDVFAAELPVRPEMERGRFMISLAALAEALGGGADWDPNTQAAVVTVPVPRTADHNTPKDFPREGEPPPEPEPGYFQPLDPDEALSRYENDDPFVLVQYDGAVSPEAPREIIKAAADKRVKIYGLDMANETAARELPFSLDGGYAVNMYFINGYGRVTAHGDPDYRQAADALDAYMNE